MHEQVVDLAGTATKQLIILTSNYTETDTIYTIHVHRVANKKVLLSTKLSLN